MIVGNVSCICARSRRTKHPDIMAKEKKVKSDARQIVERLIGFCDYCLQHDTHLNAEGVKVLLEKLKRLV